MELKVKLENAVQKKNLEKELAGSHEGLTEEVVPEQKVEPFCTR